jgi:orotate phosphoribosyltransferase
MFDYENVIDSVSLYKEDYWIREFSRRGALWLHDGYSKSPHALLTSGKHSSGFFNSSIITGEYPRFAFEAAGSLCKKIQDYHKRYKHIDWVFGSVHGATCIANNIGVLLNISAGFTEKQFGEGYELMKVSKRFSVKRDDKILMVEDVITTGGTTIRSIRSLEIDGALVLPFVASFVNRSGSEVLDGRNIISLIEKDMPIWEPLDCPLCKEGSKAISPKENWDELVKSTISSSM